MTTNLLFNFTVDKDSNTVLVEREFSANVAMLWDAWTKPELLAHWWAPKPWRAETVSMDFRPGGTWRYCMVGPEGERHYAIAEYDEIEIQKSFSGLDAFTDEHGVINNAHPRSKWDVKFMPHQETTLVQINISYATLNDLETIIQMGFKEGFTMALGNLDQYFEAQLMLRQQIKKDNKQRVCTYLNFPGNTEEAFLFYKSVFKSEFSSGGIQRFADLPNDGSQPPVADTLKQLVLHVELPITAGHILMGTDAPKEMGFTVTNGNNMHISLEPDTKEEADRIFTELSANGNITMPLQDMFWGAYFGSFTDQFGINWMINFQHASRN